MIVSYLVSTSNHNRQAHHRPLRRLSLTLFLHQATTTIERVGHQCDCLLPCFYIKPQLGISASGTDTDCLLPCFYIKPQLYKNWQMDSIVSYLVSTSNHNPSSLSVTNLALSLTLFLHQTTTYERERCCLPALSLTLFLHQTTTVGVIDKHAGDCLLPCFYIKPQLSAREW